MTFSVMTHNLNFTKALKEVVKLTTEHKPDFLCIQECETSHENIKTIEDSGYKLADYSNSFIKWGKIYGVMTFYLPSKFTFQESNVIDLPRGMYEVLLFLFRGGRRNRSVLKTTFFYKTKKLSIFNIHLSSYATNKVRDKQMHQTFQFLDLKNEPSIVVGDFNYAYNRSNLEKILKHYNLLEATSTIFQTFKSKLTYFPIKFKLDYVLYKNLTHTHTQKIATQHSDHDPILSVFELKRKALSA